MSYITSCLPLRGCRSLCTLENCNTFPYFFFTLQQQKTTLIVSQQRCMCTHVHVRHWGMIFSAEKRRFLRRERFLLAVMLGRDPATALEDLDSSDSNTSQVRTGSGTSGISERLTKWHQYLACSLDSNFCKAVNSASTRELLEKEVNRAGSENKVCFHYTLFHWDCFEGEIDMLDVNTCKRIRRGKRK